MTGGIELTIAKENEPSSADPAAAASTSRKEKRKAAKKEKRKQKRKEVAEKERQEEEARLNDPEEMRRIQLEEEKEKERLEGERREFEERERLFLEALARKKAQEEEERRRTLLEKEEQHLKEQQVGNDMEANEDEEWEYVEEGPPEIIWQGNEIIVKKNGVRIKKKSTDQQLAKEDQHRPISNPLPPQSEAFADYKNASTILSAQELLENVAQQTPNFGTEQDKAHCPFHLKTGACRFGPRCSRVHFYPDKSCTLLIKNMYNGPGLAWEQDEGLEYTEEEVEHSFEEFYEDVHTEFLKFGEIVNFKVCRNGSYHLRGNVYAHYKSLESALHAFHSINGRFFAGKQVNCEFVAVTRWKVAICGEYMKSNLKICSRGSACNFIHCFRNPGGDYEWADWDKPPPRSWVEKMAALFGYSDQSAYDKQIGQILSWDSSKRLIRDRERYRYQRSQSKEIESSNRSSSYPYEEDNFQRTKNQRISNDKRRPQVLDGRECEEETHSRHHHRPGKKRSYDSESDTDWLDRDRDADMYRNSSRKCSRYHRKELHDSWETRSRGSHDDAIFCTDSASRRKERHAQEEHRKKSSRQQSSGIVDNLKHKKRSDSTDSSKGQSYEDWDSMSYNDHWHGRSYDFDSTSEWSDGITERCHEHRRKSLRHLTEVPRLCDDYRESNKILSDKSHDKESEQVKSELDPLQKRSSSGGMDHSSRKTVEVEFPVEHTKTDEEHVHTKSSQYDWRSKSYDSDLSSGSGKLGSLESKRELPKKSKRKFGYDDNDHTYEENKRDDSRGSLDEDVDRRGRWEPDHVDSEKRQKHRRKSCSKDGKHHIGSGSRDQTSDEDLKESKSGGSSKSSNRKHKTSSKEMDSDAKLRESGEDGKIHETKYRSHGKKTHGKKTSSQIGLEQFRKNMRLDSGLG